MFDKIKNFNRIFNTGIIAVIRADSMEQALATTEAVLNGGVDIIEITLTVPGAVDVIKELTKTYRQNEILIGAGTVLDSETARIALLAGAEFVVSPSLNRDVISLCNRYQKICMPGCMTVTEIVSALEAGAALIKLFPGNSFDPSIIKTLKGPLPQAEFVPTGGVNLDNVQDWIHNGCIAVGIGGELTKGAAEGDYQGVTETARQFVEKIRAVRPLQA